MLQAMHRSGSESMLRMDRGRHAGIVLNAIAEYKRRSPPARVSALTNRGKPSTVSLRNLPSPKMISLCSVFGHRSDTVLSLFGRRKIAGPLRDVGFEQLLELLRGLVRTLNELRLVVVHPVLRVE